LHPCEVLLEDFLFLKTPQQYSLQPNSFRMKVFPVCLAPWSSSGFRLEDDFHFINSSIKQVSPVIVDWRLLIDD
jgi:hypothetical protein